MNKLDRVALVVSHPAHAAMVAGLVQRFRPYLLIVGQSFVQQSILRHGLSLMGLQDKATFLDLPDAESYSRVLVGDYSLHLTLGRQILKWLQKIQPTAVFGDSFELSNFQHDATRLLLDAAINEYQRQQVDGGGNLRNYEIPICCRIKDGTDNLIFQTFPQGSYEEFALSESEVNTKLSIGEWASQHDAFVEKVCGLIPNVRSEPYREVPPNRDYRVPPVGLKKHYDDRGREEVLAGHYSAPILFGQHFVPLVNAVVGADWSEGKLAD